MKEAEINLKDNLSFIRLSINDEEFPLYKEELVYLYLIQKKINGEFCFMV